ncbi:hypothetical protein DER44DRAFT_796588 [Fusarium oxysporum]|nr:hypothetical protein DER44DRAFT_796588 [Fusarium oxysporum]
MRSLLFTVQMIPHLCCGRPDASQLQATDARTCRRHKTQRHNLSYYFPCTPTPVYPSQPYQSDLFNFSSHELYPPTA